MPRISKKIGIFVGYFVPHVGGVERYTDKLSTALKKLGYEIVIVTFNDNNSKEYEVSDERTIYRLPILNAFKNRYPIPRISSNYRELKKKISDENIDFFIVNTRFHLTSLIGARIGKKQNKPVVLIEHGSAHLTVDNKLLDFFGRIYEHILTIIIKKYIDGYYGVSKACNEWSHHFGIQPSGVFYNSIDINDEKTASNRFDRKFKKDEIVIAYAGRLIQQKGIINLLDAFVELCRADSKQRYRLVVAGDGDLYETINKEYKSKNIDIVGRLSLVDVLSLFKNSDIFVLPSLHPEGLPTAVLEAGLMGCPVISTPAGGAKEIISSSKYGVLVDGSVDSLINATRLLAFDELLRKDISKNLRNRVENYFSWDSTAAEVDLAYKKYVN